MDVVDSEDEEALGEILGDLNLKGADDVFPDEFFELVLQVVFSFGELEKVRFEYTSVRKSHAPVPVLTWLRLNPLVELIAEVENVRVSLANFFGTVWFALLRHEKCLGKNFLSRGSSSALSSQRSRCDSSSRSAARRAATDPLKCESPKLNLRDSASER